MIRNASESLQTKIFLGKITQIPSIKYFLERGKNFVIGNSGGNFSTD